MAKSGVFIRVFVTISAMSLERRDALHIL